MGLKSGSVHCRLFCVLAQNADVGVILRRGPKKWVQVIKWDTANDTFEPGQWFHGTIDKMAYDVSPDGKLMIYGAVKHDHLAFRDESYGRSWVAISRPPYLTALALWPVSMSGWGGLFETDTRVLLDVPLAIIPKAHPDHKPQGIDLITGPIIRSGGWLFLRRLERDGWVRTQYLISSRQDNHFITQQFMIYEKSCPDQSLTLVMSFESADFVYSIRHANGETSLDGVEWADWDRRGRLVFARAGKIVTVTVDASGQWQETVLADFAAARFERIKAPEWATRW